MRTTRPAARRRAHRPTRRPNGGTDRVGTRLRETRERFGLSQKDLAAQAGISQSRLQRYESGETVLPVDVLARFCRVFAEAEIGALRDAILGDSEIAA